MRIYNSLTRKVEDFRPQHSDLITMYCCGPLAFDQTTIDRFRTYTLSDLLLRVLNMNGYKVHYVMDITDIDHISGELGLDANSVDDAGKKNLGRNTADFFKEFLKQYDKLNLKRPFRFVKASEFVDEQIKIIGILEEKGFTYKTSDGLYFDTSLFPKYGELSGLSVTNIREGTRKDPNSEKKNPTDFVLWKNTNTNIKRQQEWQSPWGIGIPGWHLECSAITLNELGETIDIHIGGEDLKMIQHQNEIAQSESVTGKPYAKYWVHGSYLLVDNSKINRNAENTYTIPELENRGYRSMDLRYYFLTTHYRETLNFTWEGLKEAKDELNKLCDLVAGYKPEKEGKISEKYLDKFKTCVNEDLDFPEALNVVWETLKNSISEPSKIATVLKMDEILGLRLDEKVGYDIPQKVIDLASTRQEYRKNGIWDKADVIKKEILENGYVMEDVPEGGYRLKRRT